MSLLDRDLDCFLAICAARNLSRAALALGVSQPALTRSLQRLEGRFGAQLFVRAPRGVELTPIGAALRTRVEKARLTLDDAEKEVAQLGAGKLGKLRIGVGHVHVSAYLVNRALFPRFLRERPAAQLQLHVAFNAELFERVGAGELDLAVCGLRDVPPPNFNCRELIATRMAVVVRHGHPLTQRKAPTIDDLAAFRAAAPGPETRVRQIVEDHMRGLGLPLPPHAVETNSWETLLDLVASTDLYSIAPIDALFRKRWDPQLAIITLPGLDITLRTGIVTRSDGYLSPLARRAIELIEQFVSDRADAYRA